MGGVELASVVRQLRAEVSRESVQEIKLVLTPVDTQAPPGPGGRPASVLIEGDAVDGED